MLRFGALFALLSVLLVSPFAAGDDAFNVTMSAHAGRMGSAGWTRKTGAAQWEGRAGGVVEWYSGPVTINNRKQNGNWLLLYGAGFWDCYNGCDQATQVWASGNKGVKWEQVMPNTEFSELMSALTVQDSKGWQYRIGGASRGSPCAASDETVYSQDGGLNWLPTTAPMPLDNNGGGRMLGSAVADSNDHIYIFGGQTCESGSSGNTITLNDMWRLQSPKSNQWTQVLGSSSGRNWPEARSVHGSVVGKYYSSSSASGVDAMYVMFGYRGFDSQAGGNLYRNDVWVTTNFQSRTATWTQLTNRATWTARGDSQLEVTSAGVLVIAGGVSNVEGTERRELNDVWASLDGGYTWGLCSDNAKWDDRVFPYTAIDNDGYLYIMGGRAVDPSGAVYQANDVWVSQLSFNDINAVASTCGLIIPPCGVGLRCMPTDDDFTQGVWGVSCNACPWDPSSAVAATPATMTMTYLFVAFLIISLVLAASLAYLVYRMRATGASSPIPLPASAQRWWNDKQGSNGLSDSLNKGTTGSEGDNMYNPLTIRDQM